MVMAERLVRLRKARGLSQKQVAADLGISQALLSHYERGIRECGLEFTVRLADYYAVTCDYLLGRGAEDDRDASADLLYRFTQALGNDQVSRLTADIFRVFSYRMLRILCDKAEGENIRLHGSASLSVLLADSYISYNSAKLATKMKKSVRRAKIEQAFSTLRASCTALTVSAEEMLEKSKH